jgi:methylmalonyl-CoA/ethylmalonyl-CoA epimerase
MPVGNNIVCQVAVVVKDIEKTARDYAEIFGLAVPEVIITDSLDKAHTRYHGKPTEARAKLAFLNLGQLVLELVEPIGGPSTWQEVLDQRGEGVHHLAFMVNGMEHTLAHLDKLGCPTVQRGDYTGGQYAYVDATKKLKLVLELLENK